MQAKLTLRLDGDVVRKAKRYSSKSRKSLSRLVSDYFTLIDAQTAAGTDLTPRVRSLLGSLAGRGLTLADHRRHQAAKHR
jgi:hypothetical protein